jgi:hypothetical protein
MKWRLGIVEGTFLLTRFLEACVHERLGFRYSPALTLRGLFLQFLTFFSSTKVRRLLPIPGTT